MHKTIFKGVGPLEVQLARLERAYATGNEDRLRKKLLAGSRADLESPLDGLQANYLLAQMKCRAEGFDLGHQIGDQLSTRADRDCRNVIDRLVRIEPGALASGAGQGIHDIGLDAQQSQFEHLEKPAGACTNDQRVSLNNHSSGCGQALSAWSSDNDAGLGGGRTILRERPGAEQAPAGE